MRFATLHYSLCMLASYDNETLLCEYCAGMQPSLPAIDSNPVKPLDLTQQV